MHLCLFSFVGQEQNEQWHPVPGVQNHGLPFQGNKPANTFEEKPWSEDCASEVYVTSWTLLSKVFRNCWCHCWGLSVKRQTTLSSELTWHRSMFCLSFWLSRALPGLAFVTSSSLAGPRGPLRQNSAVGELLICAQRSALSHM